MKSSYSSKNISARIIEYLLVHQTTTIPDLCKYFGYSRSSIRYHVKILFEESRIEEAPGKALIKKGRGRPMQTFRLSASSRETNLNDLCSGLLRFVISQTQNKDQTNQALKEVAAYITGEMPNSASLTNQLNRAVQLLNQQAYQARWEASANGPRLMFNQCPYAQLITQFPELCRLDEFVLEHLLGQSFKQIAKIDHPPGIQKSCIFEIL